MAVQFSGATTPPVPSKQAEQKSSGGCGCGSNERRADDKPKVVVAARPRKR